MNVKLSIILILSLLNILPMAAQQVKFGVEAGANLSHYLASQKHTAEQTGGMKAGFQVGATVDYEFKKTLDTFIRTDTFTEPEHHEILALHGDTFS